MWKFPCTVWKLNYFIKINRDEIKQPNTLYHSIYDSINVYYIVIAIDIRVDWRVFNFSPNDDKLVDLITSIGHPFPLLTEPPSTSDNDSDNVLHHPPTPLIKAYIQPHEGVPSSGYPFTIEPQQMVRQAFTHNTCTYILCILYTVYTVYPVYTVCTVMVYPMHGLKISA